MRVTLTQGPDIQGPDTDPKDPETNPDPDDGGPEMAWLRQQVTARVAQVAGLEQDARAARATIESLHGRVSDLQRQHRADIDTIGRHLIREADERDYCKDYDEVIDNLNRHLTIQLPSRPRDYTVECVVRIRVEVTATGEDAARDNARAMFGDIETAVDEIRNVASSSFDKDDLDVGAN